MMRSNPLDGPDAGAAGLRPNSATEAEDIVAAQPKTPQGEKLGRGPYTPLEGMTLYLRIVVPAPYEDRFTSSYKFGY